MKIAILASGYPPDIRGGGEISTRILAEALARNGADVHVLCCGSRAEQVTIDGVAITRIKSPNIFWSFDQKQTKLKELAWHALESFNPRTNAAIKRFLRRVDPDILVTSTIENFGAEAWRAPAQLGVRTVHILRSYYPICLRSTIFRQKRNCAGLCTDCRIVSYGRRAASKRIDGVVGLSRVTLDRHLEHGLFTKASRALIPDPVATHDPSVPPRALTRPPVFGYLGFLTPNKGIETIADALRTGGLPPETRVLIAGTGEESYVASLKQRFAGLNAEFVGWMRNDAFLSDIEFLIVPSIWHEPFGRIVVEAFYVGTPVIGSNMGGIGEMVTPGVNGFRFTAGDAGQLAAAMKAAAEATPEQYAALSRGALHAAAGYTGDNVARRYLAYFGDVLSGGTQAGRFWPAGV